MISKGIGISWNGRLLAGTSLLALGMAVAASQPAAASCVQPTVDASCAGPVAWSSGDLAVTGSIGGTKGVTDSASVGTLTNSGTITGTSGSGVYNTQDIQSLYNSGSISGTGGGTVAGVFNASGATIDAMDNTGNITASGGAGGGAAGLYSKGTIGTLTNSGIIGAKSDGLWLEAGTIGTLDNQNHGSIGWVGNTANGTVWSGIGMSTMTIVRLDNESGGLIAGIGNGIWSYAATIGTLTNSGTISGQSGVSSYLSIGTLTNASGGTITGTANTAVYNTGAIGTLSNSGSIAGHTHGVSNTIYSGTIGSIGTLTNASGGTISGSTKSGIYNTGTIGTLSNSGSIGGAVDGINNSSTSSSIGTLINNSGGIITGTSGYGVKNSGTVTALTNSSNGTISSVVGVMNGSGSNSSANIGTLTNNGTISSTSAGIENYGTIGSLSNGGTVGTINNHKIIGKTVAIGLDSSGSVGSLVNSGTISGTSKAINISAGSFGPITNSGTIAGSIANASGNDLTINGGSGATYGTLTGYPASSTGSIANGASKLIFGSGNILLNDDITAGSVSITGANVEVDSHRAVNGNFTQGSSATLRIGVTSTSNYGQLTISGTASIASGSHVTLVGLSGFTFAVGQTYTIVHAVGGGTYNQSSLAISASNFSGKLSTSPTTSTDLIVGLLNSSTAATTSAAVASTKAVSNYSGTNTALSSLATAVGALTSTSEANKAGTQLAAHPQTSTTQAAMQPAMEVLNVVSTRVDSTRLAMKDGQLGVAAGDPGHGLAMWGEAFGGTATQDRRADTDGFSVTSGGGLVGIDTAVTDNWRAGGLVSYAQARVDDSGALAGSSTRLKSYGIFGYASYTGSPWYVDVSAGGILHKYDTTRVVAFTGFSGIANGNHDGQQFITKIEGGWPLAVGTQENNITMTPLAGLTYSRLHQDSYTETGGNGAALAVDDSTSNSLKGEIGAKIERGFRADFGDLVPEVRALWRHEFNTARQTSTADYAADENGSGAFSSQGPTPSLDSAILSVGLTLLQSDNDLSLSAKYEAELSDRYTGHTGRVRLRQAF